MTRGVKDQTDRVLAFILGYGLTYGTDQLHRGYSMVGTNKLSHAVSILSSNTEGGCFVL